MIRGGLGGNDKINGVGGWDSLTAIRVMTSITATRIRLSDGETDNDTLLTAGSTTTRWRAAPVSTHVRRHRQRHIRCRQRGRPGRRGKRDRQRGRSRIRPASAISLPSARMARSTWNCSRRPTISVPTTSTSPAMNTIKPSPAMPARTILDGGGGTDFMHGASGNDTYFVNDTTRRRHRFVVETPTRASIPCAHRRAIILGVGASIEGLTTTNGAGSTAIDADRQRPRTGHRRQ